jgi:peptide/nickel transport system permease protein
VTDHLGLVTYIIRRLLLIIPILIGTTFITFIISRVTVPDPARTWAGPRASAEAIAALTARFHLSDPIYVQYLYYLRDLVTGNWGVSPTSGRPVLYDLQLYFPATAELAIAAIIITIIIGIPLGVLAAMYQNKKIDHSIRVLYLAGFSSPPFFVALLFLFVFSYYFNIFPTNGELSSNLLPPARHTGMYIVDSLITGNWIDLKDTLWHIVLPAVALALTYFGVVTRIMRSSMLEVFRKDFIRASYAKGLSGRTVVIRHAVRNAMIPTTTVLGLLLGALLGGTIVIESIFVWPGIGFYATQSIESLDFPSVMGITFLFTLGVVIANLIADILYGIIDPRIKV